MSNPYHDDARLTAYVLGELSPSEAAEVDRLLADSPEARAAVDEIRGFTDELTEHFQAEPLPALSLSQRERVMSEPKSKPAATKQTAQKPAVAGRNGNSAVVIATSLMLLAAGALMMFKTESPAERESATNRKTGPVLYNGNTGALDSFEEAEKVARTSVDLRPEPPAGEQHSLKLAVPVTKKPPVKLHTGTGGGSGQQGQGQQQSFQLQLKTAKNPQPVSPRMPALSKSRNGQWATSRPGILGPVRPHYEQRSLIAGGKSNRRFGSYYYNTPPERTISPGFFSEAGGRKAGRWGNIPSDGQVRGLYGDLAGMPSRRGYVLGDRLERLKQLGGRQGQRFRLEALSKGDNYARGIDGVGNSPHPAKPVSGEANKKSDSKPAQKKKSKTGEPAEQWFEAKDVKSVREHFSKQFDQLAKRYPARQIAILRTKRRLSAKLTDLEGRVAYLGRTGTKLPVVAGAAIVGQVVREEVKSLDVDGDGRADFGGESYDTIVENEFLTPLANPLSTLSIDVDTASYANTRRFIAQGMLPPRDAVRVEEFINYFSYDYPQPKGKDPFSVTLEAGLCPWNPTHRLVLIGLKGRELPHDKRPAANLVFLVDVSGSMNSAKKLPLVKLALEMLTDQMQAKDRISIVTYSNTAKVALEPTPGDKQDVILKAIHALRAGGSTNGAAGIQLAYAQAEKAFVKKGANRVILCTDGDFNVGVSSDNELVKLIEKQARDSKVFLSIFGFGMGNLKDSKLEKLSNKGNGNYGYIDGFNEAKKVFVEEMTGTLYTIAKDVKIQVEFNPAKVASYRLIGYENRLMAAQDFNNDKKDAGEIGAGHSVTALYEIVPKAVAKKEKKPAVDDLKYQKRVAVSDKNPASMELLTVKLRYKQPEGDKSTKIEFPLKDTGEKKPKAPSENFDWAAAVAMYALLLRDSKYAGAANLDLVRELASASMSKDPEGHRSEFVKLVHKTRELVARKLGQPVPAPRPFEAGKLKK